MRAPGVNARTIFLLLLAWGLGAREIQAQTIGGLKGTVTDETGRPLEGATIVATSADQAISGRGATSDVDGRFLIPTLPSGTDYQIAAAFPGFAPVTMTGITVQAGQATLVRIALSRLSAGLQETVQVKAAPPVISLQDTTTQSRFTSEFIDALPLLGRNYQDLLSLAPGVSDVDGDGNPNIHGARDTDVVTLVDGVSTTDPLTGKVGAQLNIDSIQEIEVKTSGATAEFSRAQGGFANIITKSGGNQFEGNFKIYYRGSTLDGDGAGIDDPSLHAGLGENGLRDLTFQDVLPFLSLSGPISKDRAWFFLASEYVQIQEPVNALSAAFVAEQKEFRQFAKVTWQAAPNHRLAFSLNYDPQTFKNQGLNSFTKEESSYVLNQGGLVLTAKWVGILGPYVSLETSISGFDERPAKSPTLDPDTNGNRFIWADRNGNGFSEASEYDPGEDYDLDGAFDVFEDRFLPKGVLNQNEDLDGDNRLTPPHACEGAMREDADCDGHLDFQAEDDNGNGLLDPGEDRDGDGRLDAGTEDRNHNNHLDDTPHPASDYPYGERTPPPADRFYTIDQQTGRTTGPYYEDFDDQRQRFTLRQDLTLFVPDFYGSHDLKTGIVVEREQYHSNASGRPIVAPIAPDPNSDGSGVALTTIRTILPAETAVDNEATNLTTGVYVQDSWKPFPNLSFGLGVRFDREATDSFGYTPFDPREQRALFDRVNALRGGELTKDDDLTEGNNDGIRSYGIRGDPWFAALPEYAIGWDHTPVMETLRLAALSRLTRHHLSSTILSAQLSTLFPELRNGGEVSTDRLAQLGIQAQGKEPFRLTNNNLAPRLSVAWDPFSDGRTKLFATWGRYYDKLFLSTIVGEEGPDNVNRYYVLDGDGVTGLGVPNRMMGTPISKAPPSATQIDRGLQTPWSDELTVGFERELAPELSLSLTYVSRNYRQQLQDIDINHSIRTGPNGKPVDQLGLLPSDDPTAITDPGARLPDGRPDLYINDFFFNQILRVSNYNQARYRAVIVEMVKRLSRKWEVQGSYTYSRAQGAAEDFQSRLGNDPSTVESEYGYLDFDQRHVVKMSAGMFLPRDWQLGLTASWGSGLPYSVVSKFFALDNVGYQQFRTRYGESVVNSKNQVEWVSEPRNDHRNNAVLNLGARARKTFVLGRNTAGIFLEVFNILNTDDLHLVSYEVSPMKNQGVDTPNGQGPLQLNGTRAFGRRFQIGFQIDF
ncbi:MAG TPA: carboxypeptidase regulatory-like domain-containing protein [Candidatus Polarisedimenticolia bacterium]|nr:carboxypeptidase regulatory-like domain-containing protein [Candidatus Polarisedimenticolia bacterium]